MSTTLWPALVAAVLGRGASSRLRPEDSAAGAGAGAGAGAAGELQAAVARAWSPLYALLVATLFGQHALYWWAGLVCFVALAYATNPSEASFKTHLTDLSFHLHLRRLRAHELDAHANSNSNNDTVPGDYRRAASSSTSANAPSGAALHPSSATRAARDGLSGKSATEGKGKGSQSTSVNGRTTRIKHGRDAHYSNGEAGRPHVLSFSNRVSISLKTPAYTRTSYGLFSTARILPVPAAKPAPTPKGSGRAFSNGATPIARRSSTTLDKGSKKSSNPASSTSISVTGSSSSRKNGLVSSVVQGISSTFSDTMYTPWLQQGGFFVGFLGYWWTIDDGTSYSGAREKTRLDNSLLAVEEQDDEDDVSVDHAVEAARIDDLEGGHANYDASTPARVEEIAIPATQSNGTAATQAPAKRKPNKGSQAQQGSFRGGQRRSSPTPRQISTGNIKKKGASSTTSPTQSGEVTPITRQGSSGLEQQSSSTSTADARGDLLSTNADRNLPGLPFHVNQAAANLANGVQTNASADEQKEGSQFLDIEDAEVKAALKDAVDGIPTVSHSASAPDAAVATVSPAIALLQSQLDDLRTASATTQSRLEAEVEELQSRKNDEDAIRTDLKARAKSLEETKREAEVERLEAEKKLISARSQKKSIEDRVTKARNELSKLEKKEKEVQERLERARLERAAKLEELREQVKQRESLLQKEEEATDKLDKRVAALEAEIEDRKQDLFQFRREEANAAAQAVTNRMNRAGRGVGHAHPAAPPAAKRVHHPGPAPHAHHAHRHPSQHPNAAVPVAYPYIAADDGGQSVVRSPSPSLSPTGGVHSSGNVSTAASVPSSLGGNFLDPRGANRRVQGASAHPNAAQPVHSSVNTSVIGNSTSAANALYNRPHLGAYGSDELYDEHGGQDMDYNSVPGSTFAPFGPASPTRSSVMEGTSPLGRTIRSPSLLQTAYFTGDKQAGQEDSRLHMSRSRENFLSAVGQERSSGAVGADTQGIRSPDHVQAATGVQTPSPQEDSHQNAAEGKSYMTARGGREGDGKTDAAKYGRRRESFDSVDSFTSSNGGPLSPMTPHQTSLIPSQLFDMLDEVELPNSPSPYQHLDEPHYNYSQGVNRQDATAKRTGQQDELGHNTPVPQVAELPRNAEDQERAFDQQQQQQPTQARRSSGMYSPWADFDLDAGFDFDKPLHLAGQTGSNAVSRKPSGAARYDLIRQTSGGSPLSGNGPAGNGAEGEQPSVFAQHTGGGGYHHGHHTSVGSIGQRSNTSSSGGSVSPSLAAGGAMNPATSAAINANAALASQYALGKISPNDLLFDKARHVLSLNPDAKAFSFKKPLPSSGSTGSLGSIKGSGLPSNAVGDPRQAFDGALGSASSAPGSGHESPVLGSSNSNASGAGTWASPSLGNRGLAGVSHLGYGHAGGNSNSNNAGSLRDSVRSSSGPAASTTSNSTSAPGSTFSPFDDDDLLKGW